MDSLKWYDVAMRQRDEIESLREQLRLRHVIEASARQVIEAYMHGDKKALAATMRGLGDSIAEDAR